MAISAVSAEDNATIDIVSVGETTELVNVNSDVDTCADFNLNDDSVIYLLEGSFTGKFIRPNHSIPVTDVLGNPVITEED